MDDETRARLDRSINDPIQQSARARVLEVLPGEFKKLGELAFVQGHIIGDDRKTGNSPFGHGTDAVVAASRLLRLAASLLEGCAILLNQSNNYAASALSRQILEIEYLIWTFNNEIESAETWLRSDKSQRMKYFTPSAMRKRSAGWFKNSDYANHCEMGGHPVPGSEILIQDNAKVTQFIMADCAKHARNIYLSANIFFKRHNLEVGQETGLADQALENWLRVEQIN